MISSDDLKPVQTKKMTLQESYLLKSENIKTRVKRIFLVNFQLVSCVPPMTYLFIQSQQLKGRKYVQI